MDCVFQETEPRGDDGKCRMVCIACGRKTAPTIHPPERVHANCRVASFPLPGFELKALLAELGVTAQGDCGCDPHAYQMNVWGINGSREHRAEIVGWLIEAAKERGWAAHLAAKIASGSLVDEAIRRAEEKASAPPASPA